MRKKGMFLGLKWAPKRVVKENVARNCMILKYNEVKHNRKYVLRVLGNHADILV